MSGSIEEVLSKLNSGAISVTGRLIDASNATLYATCTNKDDEMICIYKPIAGERPLWDFPDGSLANREYLTFLLSHWLGLNIVPPTVLRDGPFGTGMVQQWIEIDQSVDLMEFFKEDDPRLRRIALLDLIVNNTDRKIGHLIPDLSGHVYGCDHGVTFHEEDKLRTVLWQWAGQAFTSEELGTLEIARELFVNSKREIIAGLIDTTEINATIARLDLVIEARTFPYPSTEWPAVPWPPF